METIGNSELKSGLESGQLVVIDVLPAFSFEAEHIPGAINACVYEMAFLENLGKQDVAKSAAVAVYDTGGGSHAAGDAARKMGEAGYTNVSVLKDGLAAWKAAGEAVEGSGVLPPVAPVTYPRQLELDPEASLIRWTGRNFANQHFGTLQFSAGSLTFGEEGKLVGGELTIDMNSIGVDDIPDESIAGVLIAHLVSDDFFETAKYPVARIALDAVEALSSLPNGAPNLKVTASLTMKDVTAPVEFEAAGGFDADGQFVAQASLDIDRTLWNVLYGSGKFYQRIGMHLVNDRISLEIKVAAGPSTG